MSYLQNQQLASSVIMVKPVDFGFNEQTGADNEYQNRPNNLTDRQVTHQANIEFERARTLIESKGIQTVLLGKPKNAGTIPDAIFPNNWFSTRTNGDIFVYPMKTVNRQDEVQVDELIDRLAANYQVGQLVDWRDKLNAVLADQTSTISPVLEGTGSIIFHHPSHQLFAAISERCQASAIRYFADTLDYKTTLFETRSATGSPVYHSNVLMSVGLDFAVIALETVVAAQQKSVSLALEDCVNELLIITEQQMAEHFCGNILQLSNDKSVPHIALSDSAWRGFTRKQIKQLENHGELVICDIPTIESVGGGSIRCMLAENFLPKIQNN